MKTFLIILCGLAIISSVWSLDYCSKICKYYVSRPEQCRGRLISNTECEVKHVRCNPTGFQPSCDKPSRVPLNEPEKKFFVEKHNEKRDFIAGGGNTYFACRMGTMQWDDDLAELAALNNHYCDLSHDHCHDTDVYQHSGQNVFHNFSVNGYVELELYEQIENAINGWFNEVQNIQPHDIIEYPSSSPRTIGHYTVMVGDSNIRVGCAVANYNKDTVWDGISYPTKYILITCNYARTNMIGTPVFHPCNSVAANCTTKRNSKYPNLCSEKEEYNINEYKKLI